MSPLNTSHRRSVANHGADNVTNLLAPVLLQVAYHRLENVLRYNEDSKTLDGHLMEKMNMAMKSKANTITNANDKARERRAWNITLISYLASARPVVESYGSSRDHLAVVPAACASSRNGVVW